MNFSEYTAPGKLIDSDHPDVIAFAQRIAGGETDDVAKAVELYYAVRDEIFYDAYRIGENRSYFRASDCLHDKRGFCVPKAALLAAAARALGIPARVGYSDVRNHLSSKKLLDLIGSDLFAWHSFTELYLEGRWVKATPAFNLRLCERFGVRPLEFDGRTDSLFQEYDVNGRRHMEYVRDRGSFADVPYEAILADFKIAYPLLLKNAATTRDTAFAVEP